MAKEIEYAVSEAFMLNLSTEQGIKFVMRVSIVLGKLQSKQFNNVIVSCRHTMKQQILYLHKIIGQLAEWSKAGDY